jgi:hypothetical protein
MVLEKGNDFRKKEMILEKELKIVVQWYSQIIYVKVLDERGFLGVIIVHEIRVIGLCMPVVGSCDPTP